MNPRRLIPSMSLLLAFESAARHLSFTRAAEELSLTPSAVSRQVQSLEDSLGITLFQRVGRQVTLTDAGTLYLREMSAALGRIRNATLQVGAFPYGGGAVNLAVLPGFGASWLMPRLAAFYAQHPGVLVHLHSRIGEIDMDMAGMDAVINAGDGQWTGLVSHRLAGEEMVVVASPALLAQSPIRTPDHLYHHRLLQIASRSDNWPRWFAAQGLAADALRAGPRFDLTSHLVQAVESAIGVGLVPYDLCRVSLDNGTLVNVFDCTYPSALSYYFSYPPHKLTLPALVALRDCLLDDLEGASQIQESHE